LIIKHRGTSTDMQVSNKNMNGETAKHRCDTIDDRKTAYDSSKRKVSRNLWDRHALPSR
jgi:hypothetical protein